MSVVRVSLRELENWLSSREVADQLGVSRTTAVKLGNEGYIRAARTHLGLLFDPNAVEEYRQRHVRDRG